jgi:hypothetical protein
MFNGYCDNATPVAEQPRALRSKTADALKPYLPRGGAAWVLGHV